MQVEIWSDVACPWCYVGKARFEEALRRFEHRDDVMITWRSFELDPRAPPERDGSYVDHLARKYGRSPQDAQQMLEHMTAMAAGEGLVIDNERFAEEVRMDEALAANAGIHAVPCFVIDRAMGASGAQDPADLLRFLEAGWERRRAAA